MSETNDWRLWVRFHDWREQMELFVVQIEQAGQSPQRLTFGQQTIVDDNDELNPSFFTASA